MIFNPDNSDLPTREGWSNSVKDIREKRGSMGVEWGTNTAVGFNIQYPEIMDGVSTAYEDFRKPAKVKTKAKTNL